MLAYCVARLGSEIELGTFQKPAFCRNIQTTTYVTTVATTAVGTLLIVVKNWCVHVQIYIPNMLLM